jgi:dsRNA-specific ribonuclease
MVIADQLYRDYASLAESDLTLKKIYLIKEQTLATAARKIGA